jgi:hypothetical protein
MRILVRVGVSVVSNGRGRAVRLWNEGMARWDERREYIRGGSKRRRNRTKRELTQYGPKRANALVLLAAAKRRNHIVAEFHPDPTREMDVRLELT